MPPNQNYPMQQPQQQQPMVGGQPPNMFNPQLSANGGFMAPKKASKLPIILAIIFGLLAMLFLILTIVFYGQMTSYRSDYQARAAVDIKKATDSQKKELEAQFAEQEKSPLRAYQAQASAASVKFNYPKTWDLYTQEDSAKGTVDNYFNENLVPSISNKDATYSLRLEVIDQNYTNVSRSLDSQVKKGALSISPYKSPNVQNAETGIKAEGDVRDGINGVMVVLPIRDKTLKIWTESGRYNQDFENFVLKSLTYSP